MNSGGAYEGFFKSLGFPAVRVHQAFNHFDFTRPGRRILVIGPMGSGKTEYSARVWRDGQVARRRSTAVAQVTASAGADRRDVFYIRSLLDAGRFPDYPPDALPYRGGYERCGERLAAVGDSFELEAVLERHPQCGTWIIDEAAFYDERVAYVLQRESEARGLVFICPGLMLNFRKEIFNATARLLLEVATDIFPLTAYCDHPDCLADGYYSFRYYRVDGRECPALYFDPLIIAGGDRQKDDPREPNYCTRCDRHHLLPGKEYTFMVLKPLGQAAARGQLGPLRAELAALAAGAEDSQLRRSVLGEQRQPYLPECEPADAPGLAALRVPCLAERALCYLCAEQNLVSAEQVRLLARELGLDRDYLARRLADNRRPVDLG